MFWTDAVQRALTLYESLWLPAGTDPGPVWIDDPGLATFCPYDHSDFFVGIDSIGAHLAIRNAATALDAVKWRPCASWRQGRSDLLVADMELWTIDRQSGSREMRELSMVIATSPGAAQSRLLHVAEATPAALVSLVRSYERHAASAGDV